MNAEALGMMYEVSNDPTILNMMIVTRTSSRCATISRTAA